MKPPSRLMFAAVTLLAAAATLSAQSMKAEIPFNFDAASARMHSGAYAVSLDYAANGSTTVRIRNLDDRKSVMAVPLTVGQPSGAGKEPSANAVVSFLCTGGRCELAKIWDGSSNVYTFATSKPGANTKLASVALRSDRGN